MVPLPGRDSGLGDGIMPMRRKDSLAGRAPALARRTPRPVAGRWTRPFGTFLARTGQAAPPRPAPRQAERTVQ